MAGGPLGWLPGFRPPPRDVYYEDDEEEDRPVRAVKAKGAAVPRDDYYDDWQRPPSWWRRLLPGRRPARAKVAAARRDDDDAMPVLPWWKRLLPGRRRAARAQAAAVRRAKDDEDAVAMPPTWKRLLFRGWAAVAFVPFMAAHLVVRAFFGLLHALHMTAVFLLTGWRSRHLAASLPALLVLGLVVGLATARALTSDTELLHRYLQAAGTAVRVNDFAAARTYYQKALQLGERRPEVRYALALCQEHLGRVAEAQALMTPLTEDGPGSYAPALLHSGQQLLAESKPSPKALQEAIIQLEQAVARQPDFVEAELLLGKLLWSAGRLSEAEAPLTRVAQKKPSVQLLLVGLCRTRGDAAGVKSHARLACDYFLPLVQSGHADEATIMGCSQAFMALDDYAAAVTVLNESLARRDNPTIRNALAGAYGSWAEAEKKARPADLEVRLRLLEEGLRQAPGDNKLMQSLFDLSQLPGPEAARARVALEKMLVKGPPSAFLHLLLGLDAWKRGQQDAGILHLEQAYKLAPDVGLVVHDLAAMLATGPHPDLPRALALSESAVQHWPDEVRFRDTRGQILVKLGRYKEALTDLEVAQRAMPDSPAVHGALAIAYEHLGMESLAEGHRRQAERKPDGK